MPFSRHLIIQNRESWLKICFYRLCAKVIINVLATSFLYFKVVKSWLQKRAELLWETWLLGTSINSGYRRGVRQVLETNSGVKMFYTVHLLCVIRIKKTKLHLETVINFARHLNERNIEHFNKSMIWVMLYTFQVCRSSYFLYILILDFVWP